MKHWILFDTEMKKTMIDYSVAALTETPLWMYSPYVGEQEKQKKNEYDKRKSW